MKPHLLLLLCTAVLSAMTRPLPAQGPPEDRGTLTLLRVAIDSATWEDVHASVFLPEAFGGVTTAASGTVSFCGRFACLVLLREGEVAPLGTVGLGVQSARGGRFSPVDSGALPPGITVAAVAAAPAPDFTTDSDSLGIIYDLTGVVLALPPALLVPIGQAMHRAGIRVDVDGTMVTVSFGAATLHLVPAWETPGVQELTFLLRREAAGNPTYRFGGRSALRFGPGRTATWSF